MKRHANRPATRRTTVTLPAESLARAERIARSRNINLSAVIAEGLDEVLKKQAMAQRADEFFKAYRKAFSGFSEVELLALDGIILGPPEE
jgi:post-segregation antitoxin (ccd killing protein)